MTPPVWVPLAGVVIIQDRQISRHRGAPGMPDRGLLEMGCARAKNLAANSEAGLAEIAEIAATCALGIAKTNAFVDGNKRTAFVTAVTFLRLNGNGFHPDPIEVVRMMEGLATGDVDEAAFAAWLTAGWTSL